MLKKSRMVRKIAREIADAADGAINAYKEGRVVEEPQVTDRILGAIEDRIQSQKFGDVVQDPKFGGVVWNARTLRNSRGVAAEEGRHGADLMGVLDIEIPGYSAKKGFLAQAKKAEPDHPFSSRDWNRLRSQCESMLKRTPDSFVFVYSKQSGIRIFPANATLELKSKNIFDLYNHGVSRLGVSRFFEDHIECSIGDSRLNSTDIEVLDALANFPVERVLELSARTP